MKTNELLSAYIEQSRMIADLLKANLAVQAGANPLVPVVANLQATIDKMQATLDRVVTAHYDRPIERTVQTLPNNQMGLFALNDQGDGAEDFERIAAALDEPSDRKFLEAVA